MAEQDRLRPLVLPAETGRPAPRTVAGVDVAYSGDGDRVAAAVVVLDAGTLEVLESATAVGTARFPYVSGLLAFRELPPLLEALGRLRTLPDLVVCDGYGVAHPRRFGLACHLGVLTGLPTIGVAKTSLRPFTHAEPGPARGSASALVDGTEEVGRVLRTQDRVRPVFVSVGHRTGLDEASALTLALAPRYRLPETTRAADALSRRTLAGAR